MVRKASKKCKRGTRGGRGKAKQVCNKEDGICILPDEVLCHVLSFLPTKDAVRASILSKRWRRFWTSVTSIDIDDMSFLSGDWDRDNEPEMRDLFMDFVERVFRLNDVSCFRKISLSCDYLYGKSQVSDLIRAVISRTMEVLDLDFNWEQEPELPPSSLTCSKLVFLKLSHLHLVDIPTLVCLPSLKILHLLGVGLYHEDSMKKLLEGCPVLQELDITDIVYDNVKTLFVQSSSLKSLRIDHENVCEDDYHPHVGIVVDATNLERLNLICDVTEQCDSNSLSSLIDLKLDCGYYDSEGADQVWGNKVVRLLRKMPNTKYMCLYYEIMQILEHARLQSLPMFLNMVRLELHIAHSWHALPYLIERSPNITTFVLCMRSTCSCDEHERHPQFRDPKCLLFHLKIISLMNFRGCVEEMKVVRYFLKNAITLKKMAIQSYHSGSKDKEWEILKKLLILPRSSSSCEIAFN